MTDPIVNETPTLDNTTVKESITLPPSKRHKKLIQVIEKGLSESKKSIDSHDAVIKCYGEDTSIFAGGGTEESAKTMLANLIEGVIDNSNERLQDDIENIFATEKIAIKLRALDSAVDQQDTELELKRETDENDRQTAREALDSAKLPDNVTIPDVLRFHIYNVKKDLKDKLLKELQHVEAETEIILDQKEAESKQLQERISKIKEKENILEQAADMCTYVNF